MGGSLLLYYTTRYFSLFFPLSSPTFMRPQMANAPWLGLPAAFFRVTSAACSTNSLTFGWRGDEHMAGAMSTPCLKMDGPKMAFQREMGHMTIDRKYIGCSVDGPLWTYMGRLWQTMGICFGFRMSESFSTRVYGGYKQPTYGISWG